MIDNGHRAWVINRVIELSTKAFKAGHNIQKFKKFDESNYIIKDLVHIEFMYSI